MEKVDQRERWARELHFISYDSALIWLTRRGDVFEESENKVAEFINVFGQTPAELRDLNAHPQWWQLNFRLTVADYKLAMVAINRRIRLSVEQVVEARALIAEGLPERMAVNLVL